VRSGATFVAPDEKRIGLDGKTYSMPQPKSKSKMQRAQEVVRDKVGSSAEG
jgi:hypothetical protein